MAVAIHSAISPSRISEEPFALAHTSKSHGCWPATSNMDSSQKCHLRDSAPGGEGGLLETILNHPLSHLSAQKGKSSSASQGTWNTILMISWWNSLHFPSTFLIPITLIQPPYGKDIKVGVESQFPAFFHSQFNHVDGTISHH